MDHDEALNVIIEALRNPTPELREYSHYGYDLYLPSLLIAHMRRQYPTKHISSSDSKECVDVSASFYEAGWTLCRRGILRPGITKMGRQATADGASGNGYSITEAGRKWLTSLTELHLIALQPHKFSALVDKYTSRFGQGYAQRSREAVSCYMSGSYLAGCAMAGASAESILLALAIAKKKDESAVLGLYRSSQGRKRLLDAVFGNVREPISSQFRSLIDVVSYWRDDASHGTQTLTGEFEAYDALTRLIRLAHLASDNWSMITSSG
jgi:hypothetical protein